MSEDFRDCMQWYCLCLNADSAYAWMQRLITVAVELIVCVVFQSGSRRLQTGFFVRCR